MNERSTPKASPNTFDGEAISRADREFLASLGDHPLVRHPLYSVPPPPRPDYDGCTTIARKNGGAASVLSGRPRLDAGELRLLHRRVHGQRRHHLAG